MGQIYVLSEYKIEALLHGAIVGRIACCDHSGDGRPYLVPLAFGYDGRSLFAHTGPGRKLDLMRANPLVTIEVDEATASDRWSSVVADGTFVEISDAGERATALRVIYPEPISIPDLSPVVVVFRIDLTAKSGRFELPD